MVIMCANMKVSDQYRIAWIDSEKCCIEKWVDAALNKAIVRPYLEYSLHARMVL